MSLDDVVFSIDKLDSDIQIFAGLIVALMLVMAFAIGWGDSHG